RRDGTVFPTLMHNSLFRDGRGNACGLLGTVRDITDIKESQESLDHERRRFQLLVENSPFGLVIVDQEGVFKYRNPQFTRIFGYSEEETPDGAAWFRAAFPDPDQRRQAIAGWIEDSRPDRIGRPRPRVFTVKCKDGNEKEIQFGAIRLHTGEDMVTLEDITERSRAEDKLRGSEENFRRIIENLQDPFYRADMNGVLTFLSPASERVAGYTPEEAVGRRIEEFYFDPAERQEFMRLMQRDGYVNDFQARLRHKNGDTVWVSTSARICRDKDGNPTGVEGIARDISDRKRHEEALRASEARYREFAEFLPQIVYEMDTKSNFTFLNQRGWEAVGYPLDMRKGPLTMTQVIDPEEHDRASANIARALAGEDVSGVEYTVVRLDGTKFPVVTYSNPIRVDDAIVGIRGVAVDITELRRIQSQLVAANTTLEDLVKVRTMDLVRANERLTEEVKERRAAEESLLLEKENLRNILETMEDGVAIIDRNYGFQYVNRSLRQAFGDSTGIKCHEYFHDEAQPCPRCHMNRVLEGRPVRQEWCSAKTGRTYDLNDVAIKNLDGTSAKLEIFRDITHRKLMEEALRDSEEKYRLVVENANESIVVIQGDQMVFLNKKASEVLGNSYEDVLSRPFSEFVHPDDRSALLDRYSRRMRGEDVQGSYYAKLLDKDGNDWWAYVNVVVMDWKGKPAALVFATDVSHIRRVEQAFRESQQRYRTIFESANDLIFIKDCQRRYVDANPAVERLFGLSSGELSGKTDRELFGDQDWDHIEELDRLALSGRTVEAEYARVIGDAAVSFHVVRVPLRDDDGRVVGLCGIARDVTERKAVYDALRKAHEDLERRVLERTSQLRTVNEGLQAEISRRESIDRKLRRSEARYRALLDAIPNPVVAYDAGGMTTYVNSAFEKTYGWSYEELLGKRIDFVPQEELEKTRLGWDTTVSGKRERLITKRFTKSGDVLDIDLRTAILRDEQGRHSESIVIHTDITHIKKAEDDLRESEARYRALFENAGDAILIMEAEGGRQGRILSANRAAEDMHGYSRDELNGLNIADLDSPEDAEKVPERVGRILKGEWIHEEVVHRKKDGTLFPVEICAGMLRIGGCRYVLAIDRDISYRKQAEAALRESEQRYRDLFDNSADLIFTTDMDGNFISVNKAVNEILGYTEAELLNPDFPHTVNHQYRELCRAVLEPRTDGASGKRDTFEALLRAKDGRPVWLEVNIRHVVTEGEIVGIQGSARDIGERKKAKLELEAALDEAEHLRDEAEKASLSKSYFVANMSHEIRTPMNAVMGLTDLALRSEPSPKIRDYLTKISQSADCLLTIIDDILDFSKIEAGKLGIDSIDFNLGDVMGRLTDLFGHRAAEKGIRLCVTIDHDVPLNLSGDPVRLGQVLVNLTSNAVKFTDRGTIVVRAVLASKDLEKAVIDFSVVDSGIGLAPENIARVFDSFTQGDGSTTRKHGGSGLGLTICKRLVRMMGGDIRAASRKGAGSTFSFKLEFPIRGTDEEGASETGPLREPEAAGNRGRGIRGARVLVVEDNDISRLVAVEMLKTAGAVVEVATGGEEAIRMVCRSDYDAVLMDVQMPGMDGLEATRTIRTFDRLRDMPIIALTAHAMTGDVELCAEAGMNDHIPKPISFRGLMSKLETWVSGGVAGVVPLPSGFTGDGGAVLSPPGLDLEDALDRLDGNHEVLIRLLSSFAEKHVDASERIERFVAGEEKEAALLLPTVLPESQATWAPAGFNKPLGSLRSPCVIGMNAYSPNYSANLILPSGKPSIPVYGWWRKTGNHTGLGQSGRRFRIRSCRYAPATGDPRGASPGKARWERPDAGAASRGSNQG
ncbi:MAG: PAS domain S-box protein, partial [Pseudomonadota bacterium]